MIYFVNIIGIYILDLILPTTKKSNKAKFCFIATTVWVLISGLRSSHVGADTQRYEVMFEDIKQVTWSELISNLQYYMSAGATKDPGYDLFVKVCQLFTYDYQVYLLIVACIIFIPMGIWIYRNSVDPFTSFLVFSGLFYSFLAITGIRQSMVMSLVVFVGYELLKKNRIKSFIILVLVAASIHRVAMLALLYILIKKVKVTDIGLVISIIISAILFMFRARYTLIASGFLGFENYAIQQEGATPFTFTVIYLLLIICTMVLSRYLLRSYEDSNMYINAIFVGLMCLPMVFVNQSAMRAVQMYSIYMMLLIPQIVEKVFNEKNKLISQTALLVAILVLLYGNNPQYTFFWQV